VRTLASTWLVSKKKDLTMSANVVLLIPEKQHETIEPVVETEIRGTKFLFFIIYISHTNLSYFTLFQASPCELNSHCANNKIDKRIKHIWC
jgi:hypothetical protein